MEHPAIENHEEMDDEDIPEEFTCFVCLDIMYKPVVLACGHISCFWCVFNAMDLAYGSQCPVCRNPYYHFPRICELLYFLILKLYPAAYKRRERQVVEEEKERGHESPQIDSNFIDSQFSKLTINQDISCPLLGEVSVGSNTTCLGDHSQTENSSQITSNKNNISNPSSSSQTTSRKPDSEVVPTNKVHITDVQCVACKQLLCRPVVLNCGHVFCETCIHEHGNVCKCPLCQCAHPNGFPNVCLVLEHFLEEQFAEEYTARKISSLHNLTAPSRKKQERDAQPCLITRNGAAFHPGVGCDYCGMSPIIGVRYKCKDCKEKMGFDLCEDCYNSSSKLPGRFNQQHTKEHQFQIFRTYVEDMLVEAGSDEGSGGSFNNNDIRVIYLTSHESDHVEMSSPGEDEWPYLANSAALPDSSHDESGS